MKFIVHFFIAFVMLIIVAGILVYSFGFIINTSRSLPLGLYKKTNRPFITGDVVMVCPPKMPVFEEAHARGYLSEGFCPHNYGFLIKRVLAKKGDVVSMGEKGVFVNHQKMPNSAPLRKDSQGRSLPTLSLNQQRLNDEVVLMGGSKLSFDARYFGPISISQIQFVVVPVFVFNP